MLRHPLGLPRTGTPDGGSTAGTADRSPPAAGAAGDGGAGAGDGAAGAGDGAAGAGSVSAGSAAETATVREIVAQLASMPPDQARFLAGFAYILGRTAQADLRITEDETREMEQIVVTHGHIPEAQAIIVVQIARTRAELFGGTEDYLVTREFRKVSTNEQRLDVLRCCFLVGSVDDSITAEESSTLTEIADELAVDQAAVRALRAEFAESFSALQAMRKTRTEAAQ